MSLLQYNSRACPDPNALGGIAAYPFPNTQWTTPIPSSPVLAPNSSGIITNFNKQWATQPVWGIYPDEGPVRYVVHGNEISWTTMHVDPNTRWPGPVGTLSVPIPSGFSPAGQGDSETIIWDVDNNHLYDFWVTGPPNQDGSWTCNTMCDANLSGFTGIYTTTPSGYGGSSLGSSCAASRMSYAGGVITLSDIMSGSIDHAIGMDVGSAGAWVAPANDCDGNLSNTNGGEYSTVPEGTRLFFPSSVAMPSGLAPFAQMVFKAIQKYGAFITDQTAGEGINFSIESWATWSAWAGGGGLSWSWVNGIGDTYTGAGVIPWPTVQNLANLFPWSQAVVYTPKRPFYGTEPTVPTAPISPAVVNGGSGILQVSWTAPSSSGTSAIAGYNVYIGTATGAQWPMPVTATAAAVASGSTSVNSTTTSLTISGLTAGTTYYCIVAAVTADGVGAGSTEVSAAA